jgi:hypothetical protein
VLAAVPMEFILGRSDDAAVAVGHIAADRKGFEFSLITALRRIDPAKRRFHPGMIHRGLTEGELSPEFLRLELRFADGSMVTSTRECPGPADEEMIGPVLEMTAGHGGDRQYRAEYWVSPLPPVGALTFVCEWPAFGIPETRVEVDVAPILDAANRSVALWPDAAG